MRRISLAALGGAALMAAAPAMADQVTVFAAASLKSGLDRFASAWEAQTGHRVVLTYAGSNLLARQILEGAPADIFISASDDWMDSVEAGDAIQPGQRRAFLGNQLVLVAHGAGAAPVTLNKDPDLAGLLNGGYLSMALVDAVPAGQYGKAALEALGLWEQVSHQVAQSDNVRAALALVARGEAPYGIVYASDAPAAGGEVTVVAQFPESSHPSIRYPAALLREARDAADTAFFEALTGADGAPFFAEAGFTPLEP